MTRTTYVFSKMHSLKNLSLFELVRYYFVCVHCLAEGERSAVCGDALLLAGQLAHIPVPRIFSQNILAKKQCSDPGPFCLDPDRIQNTEKKNCSDIFFLRNPLEIRA